MALFNKQTPEKLTDVLQELIHQKGWSSKLLEAKVPEVWKSVVGEQAAQLSSVVGMKEGVMIVLVDSSTWKVELNMRRKEIRKKINEILGTDLIKEIKIRI